MQKLTHLIFSRLFPKLPDVELPNSANLNIYHGLGQGVGWHADDEDLFRGCNEPCDIVSLSLGHAREFQLKHNRKHQESRNLPENPDTPVAQPLLLHGDLITMEGFTQKYYYHRIPYDPQVPLTNDPNLLRVNITWRWIKQHHQTCPMHLAQNHRLRLKPVP